LSIKKVEAFPLIFLHLCLTSYTHHVFPYLFIAIERLAQAIGFAPWLCHSRRCIKLARGTQECHRSAQYPRKTR
jgi:hypothetical protein